MTLKIKGRGSLPPERFEAVRRPSLINQERLAHGNCDGEEVAFPWKRWLMLSILLLTNKHMFTNSLSSHSIVIINIVYFTLVSEYSRHDL